MLEVQKYLRSGKTLGDLGAEYDIDVFRHDDLPLVGLNYDVKSPKFEPIVRECRGLILEMDTWNLIGKPMTRFFNQGENPKDDAAFDWTDFVANEKIDGTMILVSPYKGSWIVSTRGTFGQHKVGGSGKTWDELFWEVSPFDKRWFSLSPDTCYVFELWTRHNVVIRHYEEPKVWLLAAYDLDMEREWCRVVVEREAKRLRVSLPEAYHLRSRDDVVRFLEGKEKEDPTYEGLVLRDRNNRRLKIKTQTYLALHHFFGNGNLYLPKRLVPLWLSQDFDEVLLRFPDVKPYLFEIGETLDRERYKLWNLWQSVNDIESQRGFAQAILPRTEFSAILFDVRKRYFGRDVSWKEFCDAWRQWPDLLLKKLFSGKEVES